LQEKSLLASKVALLHHKLHPRFKLNTYCCKWFKTGWYEVFIFV